MKVASASLPPPSSSGYTVFSSIVQECNQSGIYPAPTRPPPRSHSPLPLTYSPLSLVSCPITSPSPLHPPLLSPIWTSHTSFLQILFTIYINVCTSTVCIYMYIYTDTDPPRSSDNMYTVQYIIQTFQDRHTYSMHARTTTLPAIR